MDCYSTLKRVNGECSTNIYSLSCVRWIAGEKLLYIIGTPVWRCMIIWRDGIGGGRLRKEGLHVLLWLFRVAVWQKPTQIIKTKIWKRKKIPHKKEIIGQYHWRYWTGHGTTDWFKIGKGIHQGCILSPCLFNLYAEYIRQNIGLDEAQVGIKIAGRNINNLRYADDNHPNGRKWRGTKEPLDEGERGEWKSWLKAQH